jgi:hypothetical protein
MPSDKPFNLSGDYSVWDNSHSGGNRPFALVRGGWAMVILDHMRLDIPNSDRLFKEFPSVEVYQLLGIDERVYRDYRGGLSSNFFTQLKSQKVKGDVLTAVAVMKAELSNHITKKVQEARSQADAIQQVLETLNA